MAAPVNRKKVLFVDDEPYVLKIVKNRLASNGYEVSTASSGKEGLEKAREENPDIIVLDYSMPLMTGTETCLQLKQQEKTRKIPVVIFTARTRKGLEAECIQAGAVGIIYKPTISELLHLMNRIIRGEKIVWGKEDDL